MIPKDVSDMNTDYVNLITNHDEINLNMITNSEEIYIGNELREAQGTNILYHCLMNSLSKFGKYKVSVPNSQYKVNGLPSGNLWLKFIIR